MRKKLLQLDEMLKEMDEAPLIAKGAYVKATVNLTREILAAVVLQLEEHDRRLQQCEGGESA